MPKYQQVLEAKDPVYINSEKTEINLQIRVGNNTYHNSDEWIPFTASKNDIEEHGRILFEKAKNGEFGKVKSYS